MLSSIFSTYESILCIILNNLFTPLVYLLHTHVCLISYSTVEEYSSKEKLVKFNGSTPLWAYINITSRCSHLCKWCYGGFNGHLKDEMELEHFATILDKLKIIGIYQVSLSGGEPSEHSQFIEFVRLARQRNFMVHIVTNGEKLYPFIDELEKLKVTQVQFNYQGKRLHDEQHGIDGSYNRQQKAIKRLITSTIETTATITVGAFNLEYLPEIFEELHNLKLTRFRIWESTGRGNKFRKSIEAKKIFEHATKLAYDLGYKWVQSYDPEFEGDVGIQCPPMSNLYFHINTKYKLRFCPAVLSGEDVADFLVDSSEKILEKFHKYNKALLDKNNGKKYCVARDGV